MGQALLAWQATSVRLDLWIRLLLAARASFVLQEALRSSLAAQAISSAGHFPINAMCASPDITVPVRSW
jgi:hypothetical protein